MKRGELNRRRKLAKLEAWRERKAYGNFKRADNPPTAAVQGPVNTPGRDGAAVRRATVRASVERVRAAL